MRTIAQRHLVRACHVRQTVGNRNLTSVPKNLSRTSGIVAGMLQVTPTQTSPPRGGPRAGSRPDGAPAPGGTPRRHLPLPPRAAEAPRRHLRSIAVPLPVERGSSKHTFALPKRMPTHRYADERSCPTCEHEAGRGRRATAIPFYTFSVAEIARALVLVLRVRPSSPARSNASSSDTTSGSSDLGICHDRRGARPPMTRGRSNPYGMRTFVKSVPS